MYLDERPIGQFCGQPVYLNPEVEQLLGYCPESFLEGSTLWLDLVLPEDRDKLSAPHPHMELSDERIIARSEYRMTRQDGRIIWVRDEAIITMGDEPGMALWHGVVTDTTREHEIGDQLRYQANHDTLTSLPNRTHLQIALSAALKEGLADHSCFSLLFMDLDDFKRVNDTFGHAVGDELLVAVAERISQFVRAGDTIARLGGDEFAVVLPHAAEVEAYAVAERINKALCGVFKLSIGKVSVGCSIGISCYPDHHADTEVEMMRLADLAMYAAKRGHLSVWLYTPELDNPAVRASLLRREELRLAIEQHQFVFHFQPLLNLATGRVDAVETLIRWPNATGNLMAPIEFLPLAEQTGLIRQIDTCALEAGCAQAAAWRDAGRHIRVALNISRFSLCDENFSSEVQGALFRHGLSGPEIEIEVTEEGAASDPAAFAWLAERLSSLGVRLSIDDFGTGASSLTRLLNLRESISTLKIDRSFVSSADTDVAHAAIVETITNLGHKFSQTVIAEGVETQTQLFLIHALGVDYAQGYFISRPLSAEKLNLWLDEHPRISLEPASLQNTGEISDVA